MSRYAEILRTLDRHGVRYIVVGGVAGILQGAPITTLDLDIVYARDEDNIGKLERALLEMDATFRTDPRAIRPNASHLASAGHKLLSTRYGPLDVLGTIEQESGYEELIGDTDVVVVEGMRVRALSLERLIAVKAKLVRPKDKLARLILEAALDERRKSGG